MFKLLSKFVSILVAFLFFILQDEILSVSSSNISAASRDGKDSLYFMDLFKRLDTFVDKFVNVTGVRGCGNLYIIFGDTVQEVDLAIVAAVGRDSYPNPTLISKISQLEHNLGLNLSITLQPTLVCHNATRTVSLPIVRNFLNYTTLEEFVSENYFFSKLITDHFSSAFRAVLFIHYPTLEEKLRDLIWVRQLNREMDLNSVLIVTGISNMTHNSLIENLAFMVARSMTLSTEGHMQPSLDLFGGKFHLLGERHKVVIQGKGFGHPEQKAVSRKFLTDGPNTDYSSYIPSSRMTMDILQSLSTLVEEMHEKIVLQIVRNSSDCFKEKLKLSDIGSFSFNKSLRHWEDNNYQRLLRMRGKLWTLSSPLAGVRLVEETLAEILNGTDSNTCKLNPETLLELERAERLFNTSKNAVAEYIPGLSRDSVSQISKFFDKIYQTSWKVAYNQVVDPEPDSGIWYKFIHGLFHGLSSDHNLQTRRSWYNVVNPEDYGVPNKPQGIHITIQNFPKFVDKFTFFEPEFYPKIKLVELTPARLAEVNSILQHLLGEELSITCDKDVVTISGNSIHFSEILSVKQEETGCTGTYVSLKIFATSKIHVDTDVRNMPMFTKVMNLTLIAPFVKWTPTKYCKLVAEYQSRNLDRDFFSVNDFIRPKEGSMFYASCIEDESEPGDFVFSDFNSEFLDLESASMDTTHLSKTINRYKLFARSRTLEDANNFLNLNLMELLHNLGSDLEILSYYDIEGYQNEFQLLTQDPFYQNNCTTDDLIFYLTTLSNNSQTYVPTFSNTAGGNSTDDNSVEITQLQERIAALIAKLQREGRDKSMHYNPEDIVNSNSHILRNVAFSLFILGLISSILFGIVLAYKKQSNIMEVLGHNFAALWNGFRRMRN